MISMLRASFDSFCSMPHSSRSGPLDCSQPKCSGVFPYLPLKLCCLYTLEVPHQGFSNEYTQNKMFLRRNKNNIDPQLCGILTLNTLWANSADKKLMIYFLIFPRKQNMSFHANCLNLHEMSKLLFWKKIRKIFQFILLSAVKSVYI